ncbi:hypothetical protein Dimus_033450, partial [Dionaea muscipula]
MPIAFMAKRGRPRKVVVARGPLVRQDSCPKEGEGKEAEGEVEGEDELGEMVLGCEGEIDDGDLEKRAGNPNSQP